jgi:hypothetical protein
LLYDEAVVQHLAGVLGFSRQAAVFVAHAHGEDGLPHIPHFVNLIFRRVNSPTDVFNTDGYTFTFVNHVHADTDVCSVER